MDVSGLEDRVRRSIGGDPSQKPTHSVKRTSAIDVVCMEENLPRKQRGIYQVEKAARQSCHGQTHVCTFLFEAPNTHLRATHIRSDRKWSGREKGPHWNLWHRQLILTDIAAPCTEQQQNSHENQGVEVSAESVGEKSKQLG